jgi:hypothetical protein
MKTNMRKYLIPLFALVTIGVLSYMYNLFSFLLLAVIGLSLVVLLVSGIVRLFRANLHARWLSVPLLVIAIGLSGVVIGLFRPLEQAVIPSGNVSDKLAHAYKTDQSDRMTIRTYLGLFKENMVMRDSTRLEQANQLYKADQITLPRDKFYAAFIFHHSKQPSLYEVAQRLASEAASVNELKDDYVVQWLAKATYDRWMVSLGKPQKYGTQDKFSVSVK